MYVSVMSYSFANVLHTGEMDTASTIRFIRDLGVEAVELMDNYVHEQELTGIRATLADTGARVVCYDLSCDFVLPDRSVRQTAVEKVRAGLERAAFLGAPRVLIVPGSLKEGVSPAVARNWIVEGLQECVSDAVRLGIQLTWAAASPGV